MNRIAIVAGLAILALVAEAFDAPFASRHPHQVDPPCEAAPKVKTSLEQVYFEYDLDDEDESEEVLVMNEEVIKPSRVERVRTVSPVRTVKKDQVWHCRTHITVPGPEAVERCGYEDV